jgi:hypothetical protein
MQLCIAKVFASRVDFRLSNVNNSEAHFNGPITDEQRIVSLTCRRRTDVLCVVSKINGFFVGTMDEDR